MHFSALDTSGNLTQKDCQITSYAVYWSLTITMFSWNHTSPAFGDSVICFLINRRNNIKNTTFEYTSQVVIKYYHLSVSRCNSLYVNRDVSTAYCYQETGDGFDYLFVGFCKCYFLNIQATVEICSTNFFPSPINKLQLHVSIYRGKWLGLSRIAVTLPIP